MIALINRVTGTLMWVADDRVDKYLAAGHKPVADHSMIPGKAKPKKEVAQPKEIIPEKTVESVEEKPVRQTKNSKTKKRGMDYGLRYGG